MSSGKVMNFEMQVYNIQRFLADNGYDPEQIDVPAYIDKTLSLDQNRKLFAKKLGIPLNQMGTGLKVGICNHQDVQRKRLTNNSVITGLRIARYTVTTTRVKRIRKKDVRVKSRNVKDQEEKSNQPAGK